MLEALITSKTKRDILALVFLNPDKGYYLREIVRLISQQPNLVRSELKKLENAGIITSKRVGATICYFANKKIAIYDELREIIKKEYAFGAIIKNSLEPWHDSIMFAFIYGSYARKEERQTSDIDLMVIGNLPLEKFNVGITAAEKTLGKEVNYTVFTAKEFVGKSKTGFIAHVMKEKKIMLIGEENELKRLVERK